MKLHKHVYRSNLLIEYINTKHNSIKRYNSKLVYINTKHKHMCRTSYIKIIITIYTTSCFCIDNM